jgi:hypothetical protein
MASSPRDLATTSNKVVENEKLLQNMAALVLQQKYENLINHDSSYLNQRVRSDEDNIKRHEIKLYSQNGEDGILLHIFSRIGVKNHKFVEFGIGDAKECNTANLTLNFGWKSLLMDGLETNVASAKLFYKRMLGKDANNVRITHCFVTAENINKVLEDNGMKGEIDLLSIDIDGNDYWVWEAINAINPRLVVVEYNASLGFEKTLAVKYDPLFSRFRKHKSGLYHGASLAAFAKLAHSKSYKLIGCESTGINGTLSA